MASHPDRPTVRERVARVAQLLTTPLLPEDYLDMFAPLRAGACLRGRIEAVNPETKDAVTLVVRPGRDWKGYRPGQYVRMGVDVDGVRLYRTYSITSGPDRTDGCFTVTVKAVPEGQVSQFLVHRVTPGTLVQLDQACGDFVLPDPRPRSVLFVTGGSGITPVMGMLRHHLAELPDVVLLHSAPTPADVVFGGELRMLGRRPNLRLVERMTDTEGMLDLSALDAAVPDWRERDTWACGPTGLLDAMEGWYAQAGRGDRLALERFRPAHHAAGAGGRVTFSGSRITVDADGGRPLLEVGEEAGVLMPSGCRMGICFRCVTPLRQGVVRDLRDGRLTEAEPGDGVVVQTCISAAAGPCELEL